MNQTSTTRTTFSLTPVFEETAERYGFYDGFVRQERYVVPIESLEAYHYFGRSLAAEDLIEALEDVEVESGELLFPTRASELEAVRRHRTAFRRFLQTLSEENPLLLGRNSFYRWEKPRTPPGELAKALTTSRGYLERAYAGGYIAAEKKEIVVDYRACCGSFLVSVDRDRIGPLCAILDSSAQVASHIAGFNGLGLLGVTAHPESFLNPDYRRRELEAERSLRQVLLRWAHPDLAHVSYVNSGTEAMEKALYLARQKFPDRGTKVLAFKGSFHGRSLLALFSSWNPSKREPFQLPGYETLFVDFPEDKQPQAERPVPHSWIWNWEQAGERSFTPPEGHGDELLEREIAALMTVRKHLRSGEVFAVAVEPIQCEGGDRYASARFFQALRALTRACGVALIFDEVQSGFGLGGVPLWHTLFDLKDGEGNAVAPDFVTLAKKCQVGAVLSTIPDPAPSAAHVASMLRGYYNAMMVSPQRLEEVGDEVASFLERLAADHEIVSNPRGRGLCFSIDLPDKETAASLVNQRFHRGYMLYLAGEQTVRFRLQAISTPREIETTFDAIRRSLRWIEEHGPSEMPPQSDFQWHDPIPRRIVLPEGVDDLESADWAAILRHFSQLPDEQYEALKRTSGEHPVAWFKHAHPAREITWLTFLRFMAMDRAPRLVDLDVETWRYYHDDIMDIEKTVYEPVRRDTSEFLGGIVEHPGQVSGVMTLHGEVAGYSFAVPLEAMAEKRGPHEDPELGQGTALYSADIAVAPKFRGLGLGERLKRQQVLRARKAGYRAIRSRNRVDLTSGMMLINQSFGAHELKLYTGDYGADQADCLYWSVPLARQHDYPVDWGNGVEEPTAARLDPEDWADWDLAAVNKLSLCNWWTPNLVRYVEWLRAESPLPHLYFANGRDEATDKVLKCLIHNRSGATRALSFDGAYWGHTTACARSLSDPSWGGYFPWTHLTYPAVEGSPFNGGESLTEQERLALDGLRSQQGDELLGVFVEPVQEMTGRRVSVRFLRALRALCDELDVPLVFNECASWAYRGSDRMFFSQAADVTPDALVFYAGGQVGHALLNSRYFIATPLAMISTWDGDELSCLRLRQQVQDVQAALDETFMREVDRRLAEAVPTCDTWRGTGWVGEGRSRRVLLPPLTRLKPDFALLLEELRA